MGAETSHHVRPLRRTRPRSSILLQRLRRSLKLLRERTLDDAIVQMRATIEHLPRGHPALVARLTALGVLLVARFDQSTGIADLEEAVSLWRSALVLLDVAGMNSHHPVTAFFRRFDHAREHGHLSRAIAALRCCDRSVEERVRSRLLLPVYQASAPCSDNDLCTLPDIAKVLKGVNSYLILRLTDPTHMQDISTSVALLGCGLLFVHDDYETLSCLFSGLELARRFEVSARLEDLEKAITLIHHALENPGSLARDELAAQTWAGFRISSGFRHFRDLNNPRLLLSIMRRIVDYSGRDATALSYSGRDATALSYFLGCAHMDFFRHFGDSADLDEAIIAFKAATHILPTHESLHHLGGALIESYARFREFPNLNEALDALQQSTALAAHDPTCVPHTRAVMHRDLGVAYTLMFVDGPRRQDVAKLHAAVRELRYALALDPSDDPARAQLAIAYYHWFLSDSSQRDVLDESITILEHSVERVRLSRDTGYRARERTKVFVFLARSLAIRFDHFGLPDDRERAIQAYTDARNAMKDDSTHRLPMLNEFIVTLLRWEDRNLETDCGCMSALLRVAPLIEDAVAATGFPSDMLRAAYVHAMICLMADSIESHPTGSIPDVDFEDIKKAYKRVSFEDCITAYQRVVDLIPEVAWIGYDVSRRYTEMAGLSAFLGTAVHIAAMRSNRKSLEWFEQGRALVWNQLRNLRTHAEDFLPPDMDLLYVAAKHKVKRDSDPREQGTADPIIYRTRARERVGHFGLSERLQGVSAELEDAWWGVDTVVRRRLAREHEKAISSVRSQNGFSDFLRPVEMGDLHPACTAGPVICINMHYIACHALIYRVWPSPAPHMHARNLRIIHLPRLTPARAQEWRTRLNLSLNLQPARKSRPASSVAGNRRGIRPVLQELWLSVVLPILNELDIPTDVFPLDGDQLPHVTWCTTGSLAFLPLHAAGAYEPGSPNAFDIVISSYTPNIASLVPSPADSEALARPKILVVAQPNADGFSALPGTVQEAAAISARFPDTSTSLSGPAGTVDKALAMMKTHDYVHLACHGEQDPVDPMKSSFVLADGRLTLEKLMASSSSIGKLAFLSACETATGDEKVPDEALHLAAGMLAVGYRSVVATMWSIGDNHAPLVADAFYKKLQEQYDADGNRNVASALHHAMAELRKRVGDEQFAQWVPFVHWGV